MRDNIDLKYYKQRLKERLETIIAAQESQRKEAAPVALDQARVGRLTRMDAMQSGDYGYCIICDEEIAEGRLGFDPSILTCISCAKEADGS